MLPLFHFKLKFFKTWISVSLFSLKNLQDELEDLSEQANDVQEVMGRSYGMPELDDDDLAAELDALGDELDLEDSSYLDDAVATPSVPSSEPGAESMRVRDYFRSPKIAAFE